MTTPSKNAEALYNVLRDQAQAYRQLIELAWQERTALEANDIAQLADITCSKEYIAEKLFHWDEARVKITAHLAEQLKLSTAAPLSDIVSQFDEVNFPLQQEIKQGLKDIRQEFVKLVEQLLMLYHGNRMLLEAGLVRVNATFDYISSASLPSNGQYTAKGRNHVPSQATAGNVLNWQA